VDENVPAKQGLTDAERSTIVLGFMTVRGGLFDAYEMDRKNDLTLPLVNRGYFKRIFDWNFSAKYQHLHENDFVTCRVVSSVGYCPDCTTNATLMASDDPLERALGVKKQGAHRRIARRQRQGYQNFKDKAKTGEVVSRGCVRSWYLSLPPVCVVM
jgi:hypothetical protein